MLFGFFHYVAPGDMYVSTVCFLLTVPISLRILDKEVRMQNDTTRSKRTTPLEWASLILILVLWVSASATLAQSYYCDDLGNCTGSGISTYTDDLGNTTGRLGDDSVRLYSDPLGNTTGNIGDDRVNLYRDDLGNTSGRIGDDRVNLYSDSLGNTSGSIGDRQINCYTDSLGNTSCR